MRRRLVGILGRFAAGLLKLLLQDFLPVTLFIHRAGEAIVGITLLRSHVIEHIVEEFTSVCPRTGQPDFGTVTLRYVANRKCVELKSLKLYLQNYRNEGVYFEAVTNRIADDLAAAMEPRWLIVETDWRGRGGIRSTIRVEVGDVPPHER